MIGSSILADSIRPFLLLGLNEVSGRCDKGLKGWINDERFQVYAAPDQHSFTLAVADIQPTLRAYAAEVGWTSVASLETLASFGSSSLAPRSTAWTIIQTYYAAFFAAQCLTRLLGTACVLLDPVQLRSVTKIAYLFGFEPVPPMAGGLYRVDFDSNSRVLNASQLKGTKGGTHESFWKVFGQVMTRVSEELLTIPSLTTSVSQSSFNKISELIANLSHANVSRFCWLSTVRNGVNYDHRWATWFPYSDRPAYYDDLFRHREGWKLDPMEIDLVSYEDQPLRRFQATCNFIISLAMVSIADMAERCSSANSFHNVNALAFAHLSRL